MWQAPKNPVMRLNYLHKPDRPLVLWIDALCINPSQTLAAIREHRHQVQLMKDIYRTAQNVIIYLGCPREYTPRLFEYLQPLANLHGSHERAIEVVKTYQEIWARKQGVPPGYRSGELTILQQLHHLSPRPRWQRLWVVQEAVLARSSFIACGSQSIPFDHFLLAFEIIKQLYPTLERIYPYGQR
jgi:Heterokaryon incompatibility protein (HET)